MKDKRRKVDYVNGTIQLLKSDGNGRWHNRGRTVKSLKALDSMMNDSIYDFQITSEVDKDLTIYKENEERRRRDYFRTQQN
ncbi:MAG: hypothetical protein ABIJ14_03295 [Nanoarchaeota archaeon]|nr:hypothetical protein [Nanoarchaeota archaeon]